MLRLTIVTEDKWASLGLNAIWSLKKAFGTDQMDAVQDINDNFVSTLEKMETYPFGFTEAYKVDFLKIFTKQLGKKCLITNDWISKSNEARAHYLMNVVKLINQGKSIEEINAQLKYR